MRASSAASPVLEVGCGYGGLARHLAEGGARVALRLPLAPQPALAAERAHG